jgi:predicted lactoylglutathione lyase
VQFPSPCPEVPVADLPAAVAYYRDKLGFNIDWGEDGGEFAGVSRGDTRMFMTTPAFRSRPDFRGPIVLWLNLDNRAEIDALHDEWAKAGAIIAGPPQAMPWKLYEFLAQDIDGNYFRVFYDFAWEEREGSP